MTNLAKSLALGAAVALAACGGSSSSAPKISYTGKTTLATISDTNALSLAGVATGATGATNSVTTVAAVRTSTRSATDRVLAAARDAARALQVAPTGVVASQTQACTYGGSMAATASIANPGSGTPTFQSGDWVQIGFQSCQQTQGIVMNGVARIDIVATENGVMPLPGDPTGLQPSFTYKIKLTAYDVITTDTATGDWSGMNGDMAYSFVWDASTYTLDATISGTQFATASGNGATRTNAAMLGARPGTTGYSLSEIGEFSYDPTYGTYTATAASSGASLRMCSTEIDAPNGGCLDLSIAPPFRTLATDQYPSSGEMRVTGMGGAYVDVLANSATSVTVSWDLTGAVPAAHSVTTTWACVEGTSTTTCP